MYGVVLWSDNEERKAVIWCEDHGDLAFWSETEDSAMSGISLDAGDLIHFDICEGRDMRLASEPRLVSGGEYSGLAECLRAGSGTSAPAQEPRAAAHAGQGSDNVIAFRPRAAGQRLAS